MEELLNNQQKIRFSGSGTSHQNGAAERAIKMVVSMTSTMFMHAVIICNEDTFSAYICPMTMDCDVRVYNWTPNMQYGLSSIEIWSS